MDKQLVGSNILHDHHMIITRPHMVPHGRMWPLSACSSEFIAPQSPPSMAHKPWRLVLNCTAVIIPILLEFPFPH